jgi:hypothetical protein
MLEYLSRRPDTTRKLVSFVWKVSMGHGPEKYSRYGGEEEQVRFLYPEEERQPVRLLTENGLDKNYSSRKIQLSYQ